MNVSTPEPQPDTEHQPDTEPEPDDKDWTWVLQRRCPECGFDAAAVTGAEVAERARAATAEFVAALRRPNAGQRPAPAIWSPAEYGCHVRDVYRVMGVRLALMLDTDDPLFANWDQDATARDEAYARQDPVVVARELQQQSDRLIRQLDTVSGAQWQRFGRRSNGSVFTVDTLARYLLHDLVHHVHDVRERSST